jgi:hypothetical protein
MSERSAYLRDQADKCRWHAERICNAETRVELLKLADEYAEQAADIEIDERDAGPTSPTLWLTSERPQAERPFSGWSKAGLASYERS